ncbi:MAG: flagellar hook-basal body complex protein FliE [Magnetococcales bacterium]|nr:flagellar hook-basal body complex protein FliE [Magnetococcales bacterium]
MSSAPIKGLPPLPSLNSLASSGRSAKVQGWGDFSSMLTKQIKEVDRLQKDSKSMAQRALLGNADVSLHEAQISAAKADLHLRFLMSVRNKAVEVYKQVMSIRV